MDMSTYVNGLGLEILDGVIDIPDGVET